MPHDLADDPHWHEPGRDTYAGTAAWPRLKTPYDDFMEAQQIPIVREIGVAKIQELPLSPWERLGGRGSFIQLNGTEGRWGSSTVAAGQVVACSTNPINVSASHCSGPAISPPALGRIKPIRTFK